MLIFKECCRLTDFEEEEEGFLAPEALLGVGILMMRGRREREREEKK